MHNTTRVLIRIAALVFAGVIGYQHGGALMAVAAPTVLSALFPHEISQ